MLINLTLSKDWLLYDKGLLHERVNFSPVMISITTLNSSIVLKAGEHVTFICVAFHKTIVKAIEY